MEETASPSGFEALGLNRQLLNAVQEAGYQQPSPIQAQAIPLVLGGHDVLGIAQTGTGKTAAYVLPLLKRLSHAQGTRPRAIILAPTRELALQISQAVADLGRYTDLRWVTLYGGVGPKTQKETLTQGVDGVVATPGRLLDLYLSGDLVLKDLKTLVLDEADKMMDMGFMPQIRKLLEVLPRKRQNLLFSATFPPKVEGLAAEFLEAPLRVEVAPQATTVDSVSQGWYAVPNIGTKLNLLTLLLADFHTWDRVFIFAKTRTSAEAIYQHLQKNTRGPIRVIHANKGQNSRINAMDEFRQGQVRILIATDVAARGLDIPKVSHVINFEVPMVYEDYVHRIGRTGRAAEVGTAITLVHQADEPHLARVEELIRMKIPQLSLPEDLAILPTPFDENQGYLRHLDTLRKKADPTFQGAFHEKKARPHTSQPKAKKGKKHNPRPSATARGTANNKPKRKR